VVSGKDLVIDLNQDGPNGPEWLTETLAHWGIDPEPFVSDLVDAFLDALADKEAGL
jgi:hypothetical protein